MPQFREHVKEALYSLMEMPALGNVVRAIAAEQGIFPNFRVDQQTFYAIQKILRPDSCCIDVGAHVGDVTKMFIERAPKGQHFAFEPLTECFEKLRRRFAGNPNLQLYRYALANEPGMREFSAVVNFPGFSGLANRTFQGRNPAIELRNVEAQRLDDIIPRDRKIDFIKLDIEGAELQALQGAQRILTESKPTLLLEFQRSAAPYFNCTPNEMFSFLRQHNYQIWSLDEWLQERPAMRLAALWDRFDQDPNCTCCAGRAAS
jgi:FkbM family methyltransferase